jgi:Zn-dependent protease
VATLSVLVMLNALLFVFNMLPLPPLASASAIGGILPERAALAVRGFLSSPVDAAARAALSRPDSA